MRLRPLSSLAPSPWAWTLVLPLLAFPLTGCPDDSTSADADEVGSDDEGEPWVAEPARGNIVLRDVVVNQGVDVAIAHDGVWVGPAERNTYVVADRDSLLRAYWEIPEDWEARPITARLDLTYPDGTEVSYEDTKMVETASFAGDLDRGWYFGLLADEFPPGLVFHISLWEGEEGHSDIPESSTVIEAPLDGPSQIGVQPEPAEIKVVMMPVVYSAPGCNTDTSTISAEVEQEFIDLIHERNPVKEVQWEYRRETPIQWNQQLNSLAELWAPLQEQRSIDGADPNVYYYALVNVCGGGIGDAAGIAPGLPPATKDAAFERVSAGVLIENGSDLGFDDYSFHTFVHEVGHNQGRPHTFCAGGGAAGTDPTYPHENGVIGVWGFGIRQFKLFSPTGTFDYMSYCSPTWVSDWTWSKTYNQIRTLTSWDYEGAPAEPSQAGEVLIGLLMKDGSETWWTTEGARELDYYSGAQSVTFDYGDETLSVPAAVEILEDGSKMVVAPVPRPSEAVAGLARIEAGVEHGIELQTPATRNWSR